MAVQMRPAQALYLWHRANLAMVRDDEPDLSQRQWAILLSVYMEDPPHTVRGLAKSLNVSKPVITRALDTMGRWSLVSRRRDEADKRNVIIQRTVEGSLYLERVADLVSKIAKELPR